MGVGDQSHWKHGFVWHLPDGYIYLGTQCYPGGRLYFEALRQLRKVVVSSER